MSSLKELSALLCANGHLLITSSQRVKYQKCVDLTLEIINSQDTSLLLQILCPPVKVRKDCDVEFLRNNSCNTIEDVFDLVITHLESSINSYLSTSACFALPISMYLIIINNKDFIGEESNISLNKIGKSENYRIKFLEICRMVIKSNRYQSNRVSFTKIAKTGVVHKENLIIRFLKKLLANDTPESVLLANASATAANSVSF